MKKYKVIYHIGDELKLSTKGKMGQIIVDDNIILQSKAKDLTIVLDKVSEIDLFMMGAGSTLKVVNNNQTIYLCVVRFCIGGLFAIVNAVATRKLLKLDLEKYNNLHS